MNFQIINFLIYNESPNNKLMMVLNNLVDFYFDRGKNKYITVIRYSACLVKDIKDNQIHLDKQQITNAVACLIFNCYLTVGPEIVCQVIGIPMRSDPASLLTNFFYIFMKVSG